MLRNTLRTGGTYLEQDGKLLGTLKEHSGKQGKNSQNILLPPPCPPHLKLNRKKSKAP